MFSDEILARYKETEKAVDKFGRIITVKRLDPSQQLKLMEMTDSANDSVRTMLFSAASVCGIDDTMIPFPRTRGELDAVIRRLDQEGFVAAGEALRKLLKIEETDSNIDFNGIGKKLTRDPVLRRALHLVKNGVPIDLAFALYPHEAIAWAVVFGEIEGGEFDWSRMKWREK